MIARIVMCWLRVVEAESCLMQIGRGGQSLKHCEFAERSLTRANSRFLKACEALSRYRLLTQAARFATARANLIAARAAEVKDKARHDEEPQQPAALALVRETA